MLFGSVCQWHGARKRRAILDLISLCGPAFVYRVQVVNWMRQRNPSLWGADAETFNPDRRYHGNEAWGGKPFAATNPASPRFSPFTYGARVMWPADGARRLHYRLSC